MGVTFMATILGLSIRRSLRQSLDLKAFERRLTEVISGHQPAARFWRIIFILVSLCAIVGAWTWLTDPETSQVSLSQSLWSHPFFTISCSVLLLLFLFGIHKRIVAASIIASRCRTFLAEYNMSCDDNGKLILKPRPAP
ncbi:nuclear envelope phosphatase-regulatory subunit 1 [Plakobranchus ocellatus]|uniref:Transmembrane protein 188 n=1 Tax=Plakobranchus ocellatus TaxID=259542 RepID=A0AAV4B613_9GAST|nr:nuclear envelope phosphatase-regulatory subunit 1 [Plakobranchus ocellatus]